ncbi:MAG: nucleoside hydrolase [Actinomycetota bacterium]
MRLWIDTDIGDDPDDAVALLGAVAHPDVDLVGVSTVAGDTARRARLAAELVDAHVVDGANLRPADVRDADPEALLAIGPLTNVARLLDAGYRPGRLALMGGARAPVRHRGVTMTVEHNFGSDASAAAMVVNDHPGVLLCPLDVTVRMWLDPEEVAALAAADGRLAPHFEDWARRRHGAPVCLHDPLALLALLEEPVVRIEPRALAVEPDGRLVDAADGSEHEVVVDVDATAAKACILALVEEYVDP